MDETTFQHQLRELKQRCSTMADISLPFGPIPREHMPPKLAPGVAPDYHHDLFMAQLRDVKCKLDCMQANVPGQRQDQAAATETPLPTTMMEVGGPAHVRDNLVGLHETIERNSTQVNESLDCLQRNLAALTRDIDDRFYGLEKAVSVLGRSSAFTPASSEASVEDLTAAREGFPAENSGSPVYGRDHLGTMRLAPLWTDPIYESEPPYDYALEGHRWVKVDQPGNAAGHEDNSSEVNDDGLTTRPQVGKFEIEGDNVGPQDGHGGLAATLPRIRNFSELPCYPRPGPDNTSEPFMAICPPKIGYISNPVAPAYNPDFRPIRDNTNSPEQPVHKLNQQENTTANGPQHKEDPYRDLPDPTQDQQLNDARQQQAEEAYDLLVNPDRPRRIYPEQGQHFLSDKQLIQYGQHTREALRRQVAHLNYCKSAADEAFKIMRSDLETRLDEAESRRNEAETEVRQWNLRAELFQAGSEAMERSKRELQEASDYEIGRLTYDLKQCEASRHHFMTKYVDENYRFKWLEQRKLQSEQHLQRQLDECESALEDSRRNRDADVSYAIQDRNEELEQLHVFCQEKDGVVYRQEQIIAQGASILQERDAQIDRLSVALDESQRSEQDAREHAAKNKRTIEKRDAQIEDLHGDVREERERRCRLEDLMRRDADVMRTKAKDVRFGSDERELGRPFVQAANNAASKGHSTRQKPLWTPQPLHSSARLPQEENRASLWKDGMHATTKHEFGSASPIGQRRQQPVRGGSTDERTPRANDDHRSRLSSNKGTEDKSGSQHRSHGKMNSNPSHHQVKPLRTNREALQLLAGWTENLQEQQQKNGRQHEQKKKAASEAPQPTRQTHAADMSHQRLAAATDVRGERLSPSSRMKAQAPTTNSSGTAENGRHALPLDTTWLPAPVERVGSVPDLRAGRRNSSESRNNHASSKEEHGAISKTASMFDLRPQKGQLPSSPQQRYRAPSVETEAESSSADEKREQQQQRGSGSRRSGGGSLVNDDY